MKRLLVASGWLGGMFAFALFGSLVGAQDEPDMPAPDSDPLPLKRLMIPPSRVAVEQERLRQGVLVQLPLGEFEALVQKAQQAQQNNKRAPTLVRSSYAAELKGNSLADGTGTWTVHHPGEGLALLPLPSLNLALSKVKNEMGAEVPIGELDGKNLVLLLEKSGMQTIFFDWSLRGTISPSGLHFDMKLPPCPLANLDLKVPADQVVSLPRVSALLTGPHDAENPQKSIWQLSLTGKSQVELDIRPLAGSPDLPPALFTQLVTKQEITPEKVKADYEFQIEVLHHPLRELVFDYDPILQPYEVTLRNAEIQSWQLRPAPAPKNKGDNPHPSLALMLREPFQGTLAGVRIRCLAPKQGDSWASPALRLRQSLSRGETLKLHVHPDVQLEKWDAGSFRLLSSTTAADGAQVLSLVDPRTGLAAPRRPAGLLKSQGQDVHTSQKTWWHLGPTGATLTADFLVDPARGNLHQFALKLPKTGKAWLVEDVTLNPASLLQSWSINGPLLLVDLRQSLSPRTTATITVRMTTVWDSPGGPSNLLDFPDLEPFLPGVREGVFHISVDPMFQANVVQNSVPPISANGSFEPFSGLPATFSFAFRDKMVTGKIRLVPSRARLQAATRTHVLLGPNSAAVNTRLELDPLMGTLAYCDLMISGGGEQRWQARTESATSLRMERLLWRDRASHLLSLGSLAPLSELVAEALSPRQVWRLHFSPPLTARHAIYLETICLAAKPEQQRWDLPLVTVLETPRQEGDIRVQTSGVDMQALLTQGLERAREVPENYADQGTHFHQVNGQIPRLVVPVVAAAPLPSTREQIDQARLISHVLEDGRLFHHLAFQSAHWNTRDLPVVLTDAQARVLATRVEGRWLDNVPTRAVEQGLEVLLPVASNTSGESIELFFTTEASWSAWPGWVRLDAAWPLLPVNPLSKQHTWRLAPGMAPLGERVWQNVSTPAGLEKTRSDLLRRAWHIDEPFLKAWLPWSKQDSTQVQNLLDAESSLRKTWTRDMTLGTALQQLLFDHVKDQALLVVDAAALAAVDLTPSTPLGTRALGTGPFWENLGLVHVACPSAVLWTTRKQLQTWQARFGFNPDELDEAIRQAVTTGRDRQGIFQSAAYWLRHAPTLAIGPDSTTDVPRSLFAGQLPAGWTTWQVRPGATEPSSLVVMRVGELQTLGILLGLATLVLFWNLRRVLTGIGWVRTCAIWLTVWGLAFVWLPAPLHTVTLGPVVAALVLGVALYLPLVFRTGKLRHPRTPSTQSMVKTPGSIVSLLFLLSFGAWSPLLSGGADPFTVLILPGETPKQNKALVSPDLLLRLKEQARNPFENQSVTMLVGAHYQGHVKGNLASFQAQFELYNCGEKGVLTVPLTGVDLQEGVFLDGAPVFPTALNGPQGGYTLVVAGKGSHRLTLSFVTRWHTLGELQELRFGVPRLLQSRLHLTAPATWQELHIAHSQGEDQVRGDKSHQELRAHLGRESIVQVRWRPEATPTVSAVVEVQEAYLWDLRPGSFSLSGLLHYNVAKGLISQVAISIPEEAEVRSVELGGTTLPARIKKWRLTGKDGNRQLQVELSSPVSGKFLLVLNLLPRLALDAGPVTLRLPAPQKAKQQQGILAYRVEGWEATDKTQGLAVTKAALDLATKVWQTAGQRDPGPPTRVYSFDRTAGLGSLQLALQPARPITLQETRCRVTPTFADVAVDLDVKSAEEEFSLLEWEVPTNVTLADVSGANLHHWNRADGIVQVWLQQPAKAVRLTLTGWTNHALKQAGDKPGRFVLPMIRPLQSRFGASLVKIQAMPGLILGAEKLVNLAPVQDESGLQYQVTREPYAGSFSIRQTAVPPETRILTRAGLNQGNFVFASHIDCQPLRGDAQQLTLRLRHWPSADVHLEVFVPDLKVAHQRVGGDHVWTIGMPGGPLRPLSLGLRGQRPLVSGERFLVPDVEMSEVHDRGRWVMLLNTALQATQVKGLTPVKDPTRELRGWPEELDRGEVKAWKIKDPSWQLAFQPRPNLADWRWRVLWGEHDIEKQNERWLHQADYLAVVQKATTIHATLPAGARLIAASWGDELLVPTVKGAQEIELSLTPTTLGRLLKIRWEYPAGDEDEMKPRSAVPQFRGLGEIHAPVTVWLPDGIQARSQPRGPVDLLLQRARGQMVLAGLLAEEAVQRKTPLPLQDILVVQKSFQKWLRQAEYELQLTGKSHADGQATAVQRATLQELRLQNQRRAVDLHYDKARKDAEKQSIWVDDASASTPLALAEQGLPVVFAPELLGNEVLLQSGTPHAFGASVVSQCLILTLLGLLVLSSSARIIRKLPSLWPEQLLALAVVGTLLFGFSMLGIALILAGTIGRFTLLSLLLARLWRHYFGHQDDTATHLPGTTA